MRSGSASESTSSGIEADRNAGALNVIGAFAEDGVDAMRVVPALGAELQSMAGWLALGAVSVGDRGELVVPLRSAL
ncbi:hypothetical protein MANY_06580 [Mycolicibacterium anyangense]|uniref:Uncharacterized protein n=1 Tax=Mycolicibacterium anyangense TaxID=1431246 RepID=A0A6N4W7E1_9MYCO|nr:hypothetical protein [Mycolicibacterium anyangense]BBZ75321.1 hypothetical protein MANY_06580 [Mycolicibacterium anyangense]